MAKRRRKRRIEKKNKKEARKALLASRQNTIFSLPLLIFMVGTTHFDYGVLDLTGGKRGLYWAVTLVVFLFFELNALGVIGGTNPGGSFCLNWS